MPPKFFIITSEKLDRFYTVLTAIISDPVSFYKILLKYSDYVDRTAQLDLLFRFAFINLDTYLSINGNFINQYLYDLLCLYDYIVTYFLVWTMDLHLMIDSIIATYRCDIDSEQIT
jgi:hypothetical protein